MKILILILLVTTSLLGEDLKFKLSEIRSNGSLIKTNTFVTTQGIFFNHLVSPTVIYWLKTYPVIAQINELHIQADAEQQDIIKYVERIHTNTILEQVIVKERNWLEQKQERKRRMTIDIVGGSLFGVGMLVTGIGIGLNNEPLIYAGSGGALAGVLTFLIGNIKLNFKYVF